MKRFAFIFILLAMAVSINAQWQYHPFAKEGKVFMTNNRKYEMKGDTVIGGNCYKRVFITENETTQYWGATRDKDMQVYMVKAGSSSEKLYYDFGYDTEYVIDLGADEARMDKPFYGITNNGEKYKISYGSCFMKNSELQHPTSYIWIDGVGNTSEPFEPLNDLGFYQCLEDGVCVFNFDIFMELMLNEKTFIESIKGSIPNPSALYDLQGRCIKGQPQKGMYIQGGKKFVK